MDLTVEWKIHLSQGVSELTWSEVKVLRKRISGWKPSNRTFAFLYSWWKNWGEEGSPQYAVFLEAQPNSRKKVLVLVFLVEVEILENSEKQ